MAFENHVIDYLRDRDLKLGVVTREQKGKFVVEDAAGRTDRVSPKQIVVTHECIGASDRGLVLQNLQAHVDAMAAEVDTELAWESVADTDTPSAIGLPELAKAYFGAGVPIEQSAMARALAADSVRFRRKGTTFTPRSAEEAEQTRVRESKEAERAAFREAALDWLNAVLSTDVPRLGPIPDDVAAFARQVEDFVLRGQTSGAEALLAEVGRKRTARETGMLILRRIGRLPADADPFLLLNGVFGGFSQAVEAHAAALPEYTPESDRVDYTRLAAFSIDDSDTREIDDAITIATGADGTTVGIHLADPAAFVARGDAVDIAAKERPLSLYLPSTTITMLPERIGCDLASLRPQVTRPTLTVAVTFSDKGDILDWRLCRAQIRTRCRLSYDEADEMLAGGLEHELAEPMSRLCTISRKLEQKRLGDGALTLSRPELKIRVEGNRVSVKVLDPQSPSRKLVSELMVLANRLAAEYALSNDVPVIYRVQDAPGSRLSPLTEYDPVSFDRAVRQLSRTRLSTHPQRHAGLGLELYTQISSPIRRYADLVIQRQLAAHLQGHESPYTATELIEVLSAAETVERQNRQLEREAERYWMIEYLRTQHHGGTFAAVVLDGTARRQMAEIEGLFVRGTVESGRSLASGDRIRVHIGDADPAKGRLPLRHVLTE